MIKTMRVVAGNMKKLRKPLWLNIINFMLKGMPYGIFYLLLLELFKPKDQIDIQKIIWIFVSMAAILIIHLLLSMVAHTKAYSTAYTLTADARLRLGEHLRKLSMGFFKRKDPGDITALLLQDMTKVETTFSHLFIDTIAFVTLPFVMALFFFFIDWRMASVMVVSVFIAIPVLLIGQKVISYFGKKHIASRNNAVSRMLEYIQGIKTLKAFNLTGIKFIRLEKSFKKLRDDSIKVEAGGGVPVLTYMTIFEVGFIGLLLLGIYLLFGGQLTIPVLIMFLVIGYHFYEPLQHVGAFATEMRYMNICAERITEVMKTNPLSDPERGTKPNNFNIEFKDVTFKYYNTDVLKNINAMFPEKSITALVGPSGSGKTTITNLIARFWDIDSGEIMIGGINIKNIKTEKLLSYVSMVFQDVYLFHDTVYNNIKIGNNNASRDQVIAAAKSAQCHEFIEKLEKGYETIVGEGGSTLSGGEKQRISIARAILKDAPIVLLDEATASLDPENELLIQNAISELVKSKTLIVIAHRLSTIAHADKILVIDNGRIIERGNHAELISVDGMYSRMWEKQQQARGWKFGAHQKSG
ncbi:MAG: ABC transporter ATP-binding protein [Methanophagales archaeon]|nr:ABC transporter ATP-binding protein [Methanophagales archaeon]